MTTLNNTNTTITTIMDYKRTPKNITVEDELWRRYDECYNYAKYCNNPEAMLVATDRMAALMGVRFDNTYEEDEE